MMKREPSLTTVVKDHTGEIGCMRFNELYPPFDNPAIRRVVLSAIDQHEFMQAVAGAEPDLIKTGIGLFVPGTPLASDRRDRHAARREGPGEAQGELAAAGYQG